MRIGVLCSRIRVEEKLLFKAMEKRGLSYDKIDDRGLILDLNNVDMKYDVILERCINHARALHALSVLDAHGVRTVNSYHVATICGDKLLTTNALVANGVPTPHTLVAFTAESALEAIEQLGYPVVLKPAVGSWGRLLSKVNDREAAEALVEHKQILGSYHHSTYYIQEYIPKPQRDIRSFVVGGETICAIYRTSQHWITNTARGAVATNCPVIPEIDDISLRAANAMGGGVVAVDILETDRGYLVNEVNYTMEFRNSIDTTGVNIPERIIDYLVQVGKQQCE